MAAAEGSGSTSETQQPGNHRIKLNVGGRLFETTFSTLQSAGPDSLLAALSNRHSAAAEDDGGEQAQPIFIDRDPEIFSVLLSVLRSNRLPSAALRRFSKQDLVDEALYYGIDSSLRSAMSPPPLLAIDASLVSTVLPAADPTPSAISPGPDDGSLWIAHGGQISSYDWSLTHLSTARTHLDSLTSLRRLWPEIAAVGSLHSPGLHFYDVSTGRHLGSLHWSDPDDPRIYKARVTAIAADSDPGLPLFAAFECPHRENCIMSVDRTTLKTAAELGRQNGGSIRVAPATKLAHLAATGLVFASAVSLGAFGYSGYMKLWDPRSGKGVWETNEPGAGRSSRFGDSFADADVDAQQMKVYKVCWKSGDVAVADMRMLGEDPWVYLEDVRSSGELRSDGGGGGSVVHCYKKQVFVSKENGLEVWSRLEQDGEGEEEEERRRYRKNMVDREEDARRGRIKMMEGGGDRLFLSREGTEGVEVWESSDSSAAIPLL